MPPPDDLRKFLQDHHQAVLITLRRDGRPQPTRVSAGVDDDGKVIVSTREPAAKTKNLRRDPRAALYVLGDNWFRDPDMMGWGTAEIVSLPEAMDGLVDYYRRIAGEHPDWDDYRAAMERDQRVLVRISIDEAGPNTWG